MYPSQYTAIHPQTSPDKTPSIRNVQVSESRDMRRRASHSAIERRRRERINDKIAEMKTMLPTCANKVGLHKLTILEEGVDYILYLKEQVRRLSGDANRTAGSTMPEPSSYISNFVDDTLFRLDPVYDVSSACPEINIKLERSDDMCTHEPTRPQPYWQQIHSTQQQYQHHNGPEHYSNRQYRMGMLEKHSASATYTSVDSMPADDMSAAATLCSVADPSKPHSPSLQLSTRRHRGASDSASNSASSHADTTCNASPTYLLQSPHGEIMTLDSILS
ncbi:hypothetical protein BSLG_000108 [Batrachochytrium salamandrivorans]|nr:hypothetical protein BSLG_000108 [Batrachochytrium salamandrivorans]